MTIAGPVRARLLRRRAGLLRRTRRASAPAEMRFSVYRPPQARARAGAGALLPRRPHLHRGDLRHQGRRAAARRRARPDAGRAGHQPARAAPARRRRRTGTSASAPASTSTRRATPWAAHYRMYSYVTRELPEVDRRELPGADGPPGHLRPLDGRPRRAGLRAAQSAAVPLGVGVRADLRAVRGAWGQKAFSRYLGDDEPRWADYDASALVRRAPVSATRSSSTRAPRTSSSPSSCARSASRPRAAPSGQRLRVAAAGRLRPRLLLHPDLHRGPPAVARAPLNADAG